MELNALHAQQAAQHVTKEVMADPPAQLAQPLLN
jgi:hypothetical protein